MNKILNTLIVWLALGALTVSLSGCGLNPTRQPISSQSPQEVSVEKKNPRYNYEHVIQPDPNYNGLGGGSLNLPGVERHDAEPK